MTNALLGYVRLAYAFMVRGLNVLLPMGTHEISAPDILKFTDFRKFALERYRHLVQLDKTYSHRRFARESGFTSPSVLSGILTGRRRLSEEGAIKFSRGLRLNESETKYFLQLVEMGQQLQNQESATG